MSVVDQDVVQGVDPRTGDPVGAPIPVTSTRSVDETVRRAADAGDSWAAMTPAARADALVALADGLDANAQDLVEIADSETALGSTRLTGEVGRTSGQLRMFAGVLRDGGYLDVVLSPATATTPDLRRMRIPVGPVAVFSASNFPFAFSVAGGDTASALAAGCAVVVKAHEAHPATSVAVAQILDTALGAIDLGLTGLVGLVHGLSAGRDLITHPQIRAAGFTGSLRGGQALAELAAGRPDPIPFFGELGSVNPVLVTRAAASARAQDIAAGYATSLTLGAGQFCTNPGLLIVPDEATLLSAIEKAVSGSAGSPMLTARMAEHFSEVVQTRTGLAALGHGRAGEGPQAPAPVVWAVSAAEYLLEPAALGAEVFGPAGLVITYQDEADLWPLIRSFAGALTATVHAEASDTELVARLLPELSRKAGRLIHNSWPTGVAVNWAQHHGGPFPASTAAGFTSVGARAIDRWLIPVAYQGFPTDLLPAELSDQNPLGIPRTVQPQG